MIWEQKTDYSSNWKLLPSGCVELIFNLGPPLKNLQAKELHKHFNPTEKFCFLSGLHTKPLKAYFPEFHVMGVQLYPLAVKTLFGFPCSEIKDWAVLGTDILPEINQIEDFLRQEVDFYKRAAYLEDFLLRKIREHSELYTAFKIRDLIPEVIFDLSCGKNTSIQAVSGYSRMHTNRLLKDWFGVPSSKALRLHQFVKAVNAFHLENDSLTDIGLTCGFYDQSHFIRTFHEFANITPGEYRKSKSHLPGQLLI